MISSARGRSPLPVSFKISLEVLLHRERRICGSDPLAERFAVNHRVTGRGGRAVPHVVQLDSARKPAFTSRFEPTA
jgi:hypothetical protein